MTAGQSDVNNPPLRISSQVVILDGDKLKLINHHHAFCFIFFNPSFPIPSPFFGPSHTQEPHFHLHSTHKIFCLPSFLLQYLLLLFYGLLVSYSVPTRTMTYLFVC